MKFEPAQNQWNNGKAVSFYPVCVFYEWVRALMCSFKVEWWKNILFRGHQSCYTIHNVYFTFCFLFPLISSALWTALFINNWQVFPYVIHPARICKIHKSDSSSSHSAMFKCGGLRYNSTLSKFSWPLCWYSCNFRESEINVRPPELASWPPRVKKDEVLDILAVSECRIIPATCRSWSFFEPMLMIYLAQWDNL